MAGVQIPWVLDLMVPAWKGIEFQSALQECSPPGEDIKLRSTQKPRAAMQNYAIIPMQLTVKNLLVPMQLTVKLSARLDGGGFGTVVGDGALMGVFGSEAGGGGAGDGSRGASFLQQPKQGMISSDALLWLLQEVKATTTRQRVSQ